MSDVERQIERWRGCLTGSESLAGSDIDELESHLREETEHLRSLGLSDEEAFLIARHRLGDTPTLDCEFSKVNVRRRILQRVSWGIMGVLLYFAALTFTNAASVLSVKLAWLGGLGWPAMDVLRHAVRAIAFLGTILLVVWMYARHLRRRTDSRHQGFTAAPVLTAIVLALGVAASVGIRVLVSQAVWRGATGPHDYRGSELWFQVHASILLAGLYLVLYWRTRREVRSQP
jgi:drug/metabolite transporter (DMT)-like permease